ncbi:MAG: hypothetical protein JOZ62_09560 [Acidobacteriaceae bacterium]|nr:hypothetical protein [Acidobacteriaceae bacterium]
MRASAVHASIQNMFSNGFFEVVLHADIAVRRQGIASSVLDKPLPRGVHFRFIFRIDVCRYNLGGTKLQVQQNCCSRHPNPFVVATKHTETAVLELTGHHTPSDD